MKKILIVTFVTFLMFNCNSTEERIAEPVLAKPAETTIVEKDCDCKSVIAEDENGNQIVIPLDKLKDTTELAEKYVELTKGKQLKLSDIVIKKATEELVVMDMRLDENLIMTVKMDVTSEELKELRRLMKELETAQPVVTYKRLKGDMFEFTFYISDKAEYSVLVQVTNLKSGWPAYFAGMGTTMLIVWLVSLL